MEKLNLKKGKALVIVAHPDDETIWMGGTILKHKNISWTIFSLCRRFDPDRQPKFLKVMKFLNARGFISDLEDEGKMSIAKSLPEIEKRIKTNIKEKNFDYIFTHNKNGEYGHKRHIGVHRVVKKMIKEKNLKTKNLFFFSYQLSKDEKFAVPVNNSDFIFRLSKKEWQIKKNIVKNLYGFKQTSFENRSCAKIETFNK